MTRARIFLLALLLSGCGGSFEPEDERATVQPVDCNAKPEMCR